MLSLIITVSFNPLHAVVESEKANKHILTAFLTYSNLRPEALTAGTPQLVDFKYKHSIQASENIKDVYLVASQIVESIDSNEIENVLKSLNETEKIVVFESLIAMLVAAKDKDKNLPFDNYSLIDYWSILDQFARTGISIDKINIVVEELYDIVRAPNVLLFGARIEKLKSNKKIDQGLKDLLINFIQMNQKLQSAELTKKIVLCRFALNSKKKT